jgi:hypothetical protein
MTNKGNFHTQSNLSQTLNTIIKQHYADLNPETKDQLPNFVSEAIQHICYNLAGVVNNSYIDTHNWENISYYSQAALHIIKDAKTKSLQQSANDPKGQ